MYFFRTGFFIGLSARYWNSLRRRAGDASVSNAPLPISGKIDTLATLHRQRRYARHLIAIRDAAVILYEGALDYAYVDTTTYTIDPFQGHAFAIPDANYNGGHANPGRMTKGATPTIPNILWKTTETKLPSSSK